MSEQTVAGSLLGYLGQVGNQERPADQAEELDHRREHAEDESEDDEPWKADPAERERLDYPEPLVPPPN